MHKSKPSIYGFSSISQYKPSMEVNSSLSTVKGSKSQCTAGFSGTGEQMWRAFSLTLQMWRGTDSWDQHPYFQTFQVKHSWFPHWMRRALYTDNTSCLQFFPSLLTATSSLFNFKQKQLGSTSCVLLELNLLLRCKHTSIWATVYTSQTAPGNLEGTGKVSCVIKVYI